MATYNENHRREPAASNRRREKAASAWNFDGSYGSPVPPVPSSAERSDQIDCYGATDVGLVRPDNQDQFLIAQTTRTLSVYQTSVGLAGSSPLLGRAQGHLFVVADGMGGHAGGTTASTLAVETLAHYVLDLMPWFARMDAARDTAVAEAMKTALASCQDRVAEAAEKDASKRQMGTTVTLAYVQWPTLLVAHVGDSRCYLYREAQLQQLTQDHTVEEQLRERGVAPGEEGVVSRWSHVLWNAVGGGTPELWPEVRLLPLRRGDTLLLCTDGLTKHVPAEVIAATLEAGEPAARSCQRLIEAANAAGGTDNITVLVVRY
ncbi:MAG: serine/threonine-protein phosphatase [Deltaproteobacteria bacterium]|nr:serine/threonine-protein phosphatase [Deltaproteobacteria bacterium]